MENILSIIEFYNINGVYYSVLDGSTITLYFGKCHPDQIIARKIVTNIEEANEVNATWIQVHELD